MSQDSDFDIFEMEGRQMYKLIKNEAVQYLDEYPQITNSFSEMFEGIKDGCSHRGKLYGIPTHVSIKALTLDKNLMEDLNLTIPDTPWTWNEFYDYAKNALEKQRTHELPDISIINGGDLYSLMMESYDIQMDLITGSVNYNNTLFKDILQLYKRIIQEKMTHKSNNPLFKAVYVDLYMGSDLLVYPPAIEVERKYCLDTVLYCINKYSVKKTAAADFLGIYLSKDVQIRPYSVPCLYKNLDLYKDELDNYIKYYGNPRVSLSNDENYTIYENLINKSVQNQLFLDSTSFISMDSNYTFFTERYNIVKSYLEDTISLGDAVNLIDQKAKYIFNE